MVPSMKLYYRFISIVGFFMLCICLMCRRYIPGYQTLIEWEYSQYQSQSRSLIEERSTQQQPSCPPSSVVVPTHPLNLSLLCSKVNVNQPVSCSDHPTYFNRLFINPNIDLEAEQFTIAILTYKRVALLKMVIPHYCGAGSKLNKLIIIWNDVKTEIPDELRSISCAVPLVFIKSKENKLTNRFIPYPEIETDAVYFIDDDRKLLHEDLIFAFQSWQQFRHKVLGYEQRLHTILSNGEYFYGDKEDSLKKNGYSLVLSTNFILHKAYLEMYQMPEFLPRTIYSYVDEKMNCEDIAIVMMVTEFLEKYSTPQSCCLSLHAKHYPYNLEAMNRGSSFRGLSMRKTHVKGRSECLNDFVKFYKNGRLPLRYTHTRLIHEPKDSYYTEKKP